MMPTTLADPLFSSVLTPYDEREVTQALINYGKNIMDNQINCETAPSDEPSVSLGHPSSVDSVSTPTSQVIQSATGALYAPMNTSPQAQQAQETKMDKLMAQLSQTLTALMMEISQREQPTLQDAVSTTLEQAQWFKDRVEENCAEAISEHDFDYEIGQNIERYMRNSFDANDHYDFDAEVRSRVEDEVESIIDGLVEEAVESRLADLLEEKLANANITINF